MTTRPCIVQDVGCLHSRYGVIHPVLYATADQDDLYGWDVLVPRRPSRAVFDAIPFLTAGDGIVIDIRDPHLDRSGLLVDVTSIKSDIHAAPHCLSCGSEIRPIHNEWVCQYANCKGRLESRLVHIGKCLGITQLANASIVSSLIKERVLTAVSDLFNLDIWALDTDWENGEYLGRPIRNQMVEICRMIRSCVLPVERAITLSMLTSLSIPGLRERDWALLLDFGVAQTNQHPLESIAAVFKSDDLFALALGKEYFKDPLCRHMYREVSPFATDFEKMVHNILDVW